MKKMTKFFALALLAGAMVSCSTEDTAPSVQNDKVAVQFTVTKACHCAVPVLQATFTG